MLPTMYYLSTYWDNISYMLEVNHYITLDFSLPWFRCSSLIVTYDFRKRMCWFIWLKQWSAALKHTHYWRVSWYCTTGIAALLPLDSNLHAYMGWFALTIHLMCTANDLAWDIMSPRQSCIRSLLSGVGVDPQLCCSRFRTNSCKAFITSSPRLWVPWAWW